jgi:hypothetical protein
MQLQEEEIQDDDLAEYERQIAALGGGEMDLGPTVKGKNAGGKSAPKKEANPGDIDLDDLDALERAIANMSDEEDDSKPVPKKMAPAPVLANPPPTKVQVVRVAPPATHLNDDDELEEPKDENGVVESILMEEEPVYHGFQKIVSIDTLTHEEENYISKIIDGELIGSDYREILETEREERQTHMNKLMRVLQSGALSLDAYLDMVQQALQNQLQLQKVAIAKKASITTQKRIENRIQLMTAEIATVKQQTQGGKPEAPPQQLSQSTIQPTAQPTTQPILQPAQISEEKLPPVNKTNTKKMELVEESTIRAKSEIIPAQKQYKISEEMLTEMSTLIIQNSYLSMYKQQIGAPVSSDTVAKLRKYKDLFNDPYSITDRHHEEVVCFFPKITTEMVIGCTAEERVKKLDEIEEEAMNSIEKMKAVACDKAEYLPTVELIKYVKSIKGIETVPVPQVTCTNIEKMWKGPFNKNVPESTLRIYLNRLSGAATHRTFFLRLGINYTGTITTVDTPWVSWSINGSNPTTGRSTSRTITHCQLRWIEVLPRAAYWSSFTRRSISSPPNSLAP